MRFFGAVTADRRAGASIRRRLIAAALCAAVFLPGAPVYASDRLYEIQKTTAVCNGVTYEESRSVTNAGLLDIHVLKVNLNDPYITINLVESGKEYGLRETVSTLLRESNAIAGVNGDFFGVNGAYSAGFGLSVKDGRLISVSADSNDGGNDFASFVYTQQNIPFISFIKTNIHFYNDGVENIQVHSINKITDMVYPVILTSQAMQNTASLDSRFPGLLKIVVIGQQITYISQLGETVNVPEDGYVLAIQQASADYFGQFFSVGQRAVLQVVPYGIDFANIKTAVGGGGLILKDGETFTMGTIASGNKREPRTAIGINREQNQLILVQVDGRTHSIGANQDEMAWIMKRYGAYNAMHLDGGGSSAMVIRDPDGQYNTVNRVSDGAERKVINALGIFNNAPVGNAEKLVAAFEKETVWLGESVKLSVYGLDAYGHRIETQPDTIAFSDPEAVYANGYYTPGNEGKADIYVQSGGMMAQAELKVKTLAELIINPEAIRLNAGEAKALSFSGIDSDGAQFNITEGVSYEVFPSELGTAFGGVFTASAISGAGYLKCTVRQATAYVPIYIGDTGDVTVTLPNKQRFRDPLRSEPNETLTEPAVIVEGEKVFSPEDREPAVYGARQNGRFAILRVTGERGGLLATDLTQWAKFPNDIDSMNPGGIVMETDLNPRNFSQPKEFELFHEALTAYQAQGKQVFVISKQGQETSTRIQDGIRYINIGAMWKDAETINENYRVFRLYASGDSLTYTLTAE
ncbi:MAG: phosphodiester glycosidase family protein [Clostridiales bacterium]|nr:phosphodiester glycosidase family protein [Clostridiales bacterium]